MLPLYLQKILYGKMNSHKTQFSGLMTQLILLIHVFTLMTILLIVHFF